MTIETITVAESEATSEGSRGGDQCLALVLLWSRDEPERVGEVALISPGRSWIMGRESLEFSRQRPGDQRDTGPLRSQKISRKQLAIMSDGTRLLVRNLGRRRLHHRGRVVSEASVVPGELLELGRVALFLCVERPVDGESFADLCRVGELGAVASEHGFGKPDSMGMIGESLIAWRLRGILGFVARRDAHVLVHGPSGVGKELVATAIHRLSPRSKHPLVARNAATMPEALIDAELFGNARNYPNSGMNERPGVVGEADGSTLFLDEIAELPESAQVHLLRVLDAGEYSRLGEARSRRADLRLVAATNRPLDCIKHDLLARFHVRVELPGLDQRREDIPLLADHVLRKICSTDDALAAQWFPRGDLDGPAAFSVELIARLTSHPYATHVRELEALLWRELVGDLGEARGSVSAPRSPAKTDSSNPEGLAPEQIQRCLDRHEGRQEPVWRELGLSSRHVLARLVRKYGLEIKGRGEQ